MSKTREFTKGKQATTAAERAEIEPYGILPLSEQQSTAAAAEAHATVEAVAQQRAQCKSCKKISTDITEVCAVCEQFICMGDECITPADSAHFTFGQSSSGPGRYLCNMCAIIQKQKQRAEKRKQARTERAAAALIAVSGQEKEKEVSNASDSESTSRESINPTLAETEQEFDLTTSEWLKRQKARLVTSILEYKYLINFRKNFANTLLVEGWC